MLLKLTAVVFLACLSAASTLLMRYGGRNLDFSQGFWHVVTHGYLWWGGIGLGWVCGLAYALLLTRWEISIVTGVFTPLVYVFTLSAAALVLNEPWSITKTVGLLLVLFGLVLLIKK